MYWMIRPPFGKFCLDLIAELLPVFGIKADDDIHADIVCLGIHIKTMDFKHFRMGFDLFVDV